MLIQNCLKACAFMVLTFLSISAEAQKRELEWVKEFHGLRGFRANQDSYGNYYVTGTFRDNMSVDGQVLLTADDGFSDAFLLKALSDGTIVWIKQISTVATGSPYLDLSVLPPDVYFDENGDILLSGTAYSPPIFLPEETESGIPKGVFLARFNPDGDFLGAMHVFDCGNPTPATTTPGGTLIHKSQDGSLYFSGEFEGSKDFDSGEGQFLMQSGRMSWGSLGSPYLLKLDASGNFQWATTWYFGGMSPAFNQNDELYISGAFNGTLNYDPITNEPVLVQINPSPYYYNYRTEWLAKINTDSGKITWIRNNIPGTLKIDPAGNLYIKGSNWGQKDLDPSLENEFYLPSSDMEFIQKLDPNGNFIWAKGIRHEGKATRFSMTDHDFSLKGILYGSTDLGISPGKTYNYRFTQQAGFVAKYTLDGELKDVISLNGDASVEPLPLGNGTFDALSGHFYETADLDPDPWSEYLVTGPTSQSGPPSFYIAKYGGSSASCPSGILHITEMAQLSIPAGCSRFDGSIVIEGEEITSLTGLENLEKITGNLVIRGTSLTNLNGLNKIEAIGKTLEITDNTSLLSLQGFGSGSSGSRNARMSSIRTIEDLIITGNQALTSCAVSFIVDHLNSVSSSWEIENNGADGACNNSGEILEEWETSLPVALASFKASLTESNSVRLDWATTAEAGASHFEVEHSLSGKEWSKIGEIKAAGNNTGLKSYTYIHTNPSLSVNYYRLRSADLGGAFAHSAIESVRLKGTEKSLAAYPNPASDRLYLNLDKTGNARSIQLYNASGIQVKVTPDAATQSLDVRHLPAGIYLLKVDENEGVSETFRVLISR